MSTVPHVYTAIAAITGELAKEGISKDRKNDQQGYKFRGIDDVYAALSPKLAAHRLCILPRVEARDVTEKVSGNGKTLFYTVLTVDFALVSAEDGSNHVIRTVGEAMDSGDKSTNKAMSAAYKYACLQAFCIPTEGDNDADQTTHTVVPIGGAKAAQQAVLAKKLAEISAENVEPPATEEDKEILGYWNRMTDKAKSLEVIRELNLQLVGVLGGEGSQAITKKILADAGVANSALMKRQQLLDAARTLVLAIRQAENTPGTTAEAAEQVENSLPELLPQPVNGKAKTRAKQEVYPD